MDTIDRNRGNKSFTIKLRYACNYSCPYCIARNAKEYPVMHSIPRLHKLYRKLDSFVVTFFDCGSSEPSLHPQIRDVLELCLRFGGVYIPTNNSIAPEKWLPPKDLKRLVIAAALHPQGEKKIEKFRDHLLRIQEMGAHVFVVLVAHPERLGEIKRMHDYFLGMSVEMHLFPFHGYWNGKAYPTSYTEAERYIMGQYFCKNTFPHIWNWAFKMSPDMEIRDFSGISCIAGYTTAYIGDDSKMQRCLYDITQLKRLNSSPKPCRVRLCGAGLQLEKLNTYDDVFWDYWRQLGRKTYQQSDFVLDHNDLYLKNKAAYWSIMDRHTKRRHSSFQNTVRDNIMFPHILYEKKNENLLNGLQISFYGKESSRKPPVLLKDKGILFQPSAKTDHLTTPYMDLLPCLKGGGDWLRITMSPIDTNTLKCRCIIYLQDEDFSRISENLLSEKEGWSTSSGTACLVCRFALPDGLQCFRLVISVLELSPFLLPNHLKIEQSDRSHLSAA